MPAEPASRYPVEPLLVVLAAPSLDPDDTAPVLFPDDPVLGARVVESALVSPLLLVEPVGAPELLVSAAVVDPALPLPEDVAGGPAVGRPPPSWHSPMCACTSEPTKWQQPSASQV